MTNNQEAEQAVNEEVDLATLEEKIEQLKSIENIIGSEEREVYLKQLQNKLQQGNELEQNLHNRINQIKQIKSEDILSLCDFLREAKLKKVQVPSIKRAKTIIKACKWIYKLHIILIIGDSSGGSNLLELEEEDLEIKFYEKVNEIQDQINELQQSNEGGIQNKLTGQQIEYFLVELSSSEISVVQDTRIKDIYNKLLIEQWNQQVSGIIQQKEEISFEELILTQKSAPENVINNNTEIYQRVRELCIKGNQWKDITNKFTLNSFQDKLNFQLNQMSNEDQQIKVKAEDKIEIYYKKIKQLYQEQQDYFKNIKEFKEQAEILLKFINWINWHKESQQYMIEIKSGKRSVQSDFLKNKIKTAEDINLPREWNSFKELYTALEHFDELQKEIELFIVSQQEQQINTKKFSFSKAKSILERVKNNLELENKMELELDNTNINSNTNSNIKPKLEQIEMNIEKCEEWLENVITFKNNTILTHEYLEDVINREFIRQTIQELRQKSMNLPFIVDEGENVLNEFQWAIEVQELLLQKTKKQPLSIWQQYLKKSQGSQCNMELINKLREHISQAEKYIEITNKLKKLENGLKNGEIQANNKQSVISVTLEDLKELITNTFSCQISLENENSYLQELFQNLVKILETLDSLMKSEPKPNITEIQKLLDSLKKLPISVKEYENALEHKIQSAQSLATKLRQTCEVNAETAENILKDYNNYNIFIADGFRLQRDYHQSQQLLEKILEKINNSTEQAPLTYDDILDLSEQADNIQFDIKEASTLKCKLYIIRVECIRESIINQQDKTLTTIKIQMDIPYQAPTKPIQITVQTLKSLIVQGYSLKKQFSTNDMLRDVIQFLEQVAGDVEDFILDIYKIKDSQKLEEIDPFCCGFVDCQNLIIDHRSCLLYNQDGYQPILESLIINDEEKLQKDIPDVIPVYILNEKSKIIMEQEENENEENKFKQSVFKGKITPSEKENKKRKKKLLENEENDEKIKKKMKIDEKDKKKEIKKQSEKEILLKEKLKNQLKQQQQQKLYQETQQQKPKKKYEDRVLLALENNQTKNQKKQQQQPKSFNVQEERKRFWEEGGFTNNNNNNRRNEDIEDSYRSENIAKLRTYLERCKYLKLTSLDALNVAKRLENSCFMENPKSRRGYEKFINAINSALKNVRKMKYISIRFMEENYSMDYLYQFKDLELETLARLNDKAKEEMIQRRLKSKDERQFLLQKRLYDTNQQQQQYEQMNKKYKINENSEKFRKNNEQISQTKKSIKNVIDTVPQTNIKKKSKPIDSSQQSRMEEITPDKTYKKKTATDDEEMLLTQNFEPIDSEYRVQKKLNNNTQHQRGQSHPTQLQSQNQTQQQRSQSQQRQQYVQGSVLKIFEGMMKFSVRSSTKVVLLTSCNYYDLLKVPRLFYNDRVPLIQQQKMPLQQYSRYFENIIRMRVRERVEVIVSGWIQTTLDLYKNLCTTIANEYLSTNTVGFTEYSEHSTLYFLHKKQIHPEWDKYIDLATKRHDPLHDSQLAFFIISKDYMYNKDYQRLVIEQFTGIIQKKKITRSESPSKLLDEATNNINKNIRTAEKPRSGTLQSLVTTTSNIQQPSYGIQNEVSFNNTNNNNPKKNFINYGFNQQGNQQQQSRGYQQRYSYSESRPKQQQQQQQQQYNQFPPFPPQPQPQHQNPYQYQNQQFNKNQNRSYQYSLRGQPNAIQDLKNAYRRTNSEHKSPHRSQFFQKNGNPEVFSKLIDDPIYLNKNKQKVQIDLTKPLATYASQQKQPQHFSNKKPQQFLNNNNNNRYNELPRFSPIGRNLQQQSPYYEDQPYPYHPQTPRNRSPYSRYPDDDYPPPPPSSHRYPPYYRDYDYYDRPFYSTPYRSYDYTPRPYPRRMPPYYDRYDAYPYEGDYPQSEYERDMLYGRPPPPPRYSNYGSRAHSVDRDYPPGPRTPLRNYPDDPYDYPPPRQSMDGGYNRRLSQDGGYRQPITPRGAPRREYAEGDY